MSLGPGPTAGTRPSARQQAEQRELFGPPRANGWQGARWAWLGGQIMCKEAQRCVGSFRSVHRARPQCEASEDGNIGDLVSGEVRYVPSDQLIGVIAKRIGGRDRNEDPEDPEA